MPITRSRGQAERWESEVRVGALANPLPASRHTDVPDLSAGTQEEAITGVNPTMFDREEVQPAKVSKPTSSKNTSKSKRKARDARREILCLKLELAQLALEDAESDSSDSEDDIKSKTEYVRSWVETSAVIQEPSPQCADIPRKPYPIPSVPEGPPRISTCPNIVTNSENRQTIHTDSLHEIEKLKNEIEYLKNIVSQRIESVPLASQHVKSELPVSTTLPQSSSSNIASKVIMNLPVYSGALNEWLSYKAIYENTKGYFNDVENTARIRRSLVGKALEVVDTQLIAHSRPDAILEEQEVNFGRPDTIAYSEYDKLRSLPRCADTPKEIHSFASKVRSSLNLFRALKLHNFITAPDMMRALREKLPSSLCTRWYEEQAYIANPDLVHFSEFLTKQAACRTPYAPPEILDDTRRIVYRTHTTTEDREPILPRRITQSTCKICEQDHDSASCNKFQDAISERRWELAKEHQLCFRCLRHRQPGHSCSPQRCGAKGCTATHHRLLHYEKKAEIEIIENPNRIEKKETVANAWIPSKPQAYLKIVPVRVLGPAGEISAYALLDDGSTVSLMDEALAEAVGAEGHLDPLKIEAIGGTGIDTPGLKRVSVTIANSSNKKVIFRARTIPNLKLSPQTVSKEDLADCNHLTDLENELLYSSAKPKIVIGQDNWNLLLVEDVRSGLNSQPVASLTTLGWVLHGVHNRVSRQEVHFVNQVTTVPLRYPWRRNRREGTRKSLPELRDRRETRGKSTFYEVIAKSQLPWCRKRIKIVNPGVDGKKKIVHTRDDPLEGPTERLVPLPKRNDAVAHRGKDAAPRRDLILHGGRNVRDGAPSLVDNSQSPTCAT